MSNDILDDFSLYSKSLKQRLQKHIRKGEQIIWAERPKQGILFRSSDGCLIPFSLFWGGFAFFWETMVQVMDAPLIFTLFGIPFVLIGIYLILGRFFHDMYIRKKTIYGLTKKRIVIKRGYKLDFLDLSSISNIHLIEKKDGSGTILFNNKDNHGTNKNNSYHFVLSPPNLVFGFEAIPNVKNIYNQIEQLRNM
ncbi:MAG: hypothetical protein MK207_00205 [Saprospiraceae bacterium]|nr:hypothetical protein [Saprospiraceae bacterium]